MSSWSLTGLLLAGAWFGCSADAPPPLKPAADLAIPDALAPNLTTLTDGEIILSALREVEGGHQLAFTPVDGTGALPVVAEGTNFFANWADVPGLVQAGDGSLLAHWLEQSGPAMYDYGIRLARSTDGGTTWTPLGWLHDDAWVAAESEIIAGEHGFVSWIPEGEGARAFWLDGRATAGHDSDGHGLAGAMQLRTASIVRGEITASELLDARVCDCCPTAAVATVSGPLVAFRDRSEDEVRDVHILRQTPRGWQRSVIDTSGWKIAGCPVNGPALAVEGNLVLAAWYTAHPEPRVYAAWSDDGGVNFDEPMLLTSDTLGRVTAVIVDGRGYVAWLNATGNAASDETTEPLPPGEILLVSLDPGGKVEPAIAIASTTATRSTGMPRLVADRGRLGLAWTEATPGEADELSTTVSFRFVPVIDSGTRQSPGEDGTRDE